MEDSWILELSQGYWHPGRGVVFDTKSVATTSKIKNLKKCKIFCSWWLIGYFEPGKSISIQHKSPKAKGKVKGVGSMHSSPSALLCHLMCTSESAPVFSEHFFRLRSGYFGTLCKSLSLSLDKAVFWGLRPGFIPHTCHCNSPSYHHSWQSYSSEL